MFEVNNLSFKYPKNTNNTIKDISFNIKKGEIFGFLGPSGAGKSTTQKLMLRLLTGGVGVIRYDGENILELGQNFYEDIGVSFEMPIHFTKMSALENMMFFQSLYKNKADIKELMTRVGLWEDKDKLISEYSKGMKIRLNIVRALINNPKMLFLDEPTNGLDPKNSMILKDMIREFRNAGGTVFITSHIMADIEQLCDRVGFIVDGKIVELSNTKKLKLDYGEKTIQVEYKEKENTVEKAFDMNKKSEMDSLSKIIKEKEIIRIHSGETTLEEIFIKVTGVNLKDSKEE